MGLKSLYKRSSGRMSGGHKVAFHKGVQPSGCIVMLIFVSCEFNRSGYEI